MIASRFYFAFIGDVASTLSFLGIALGVGSLKLKRHKTR
jgi:hypothetical protein